jgi:histidinol-phosphate/aromatic aminotransferase/cobyric acid decarboxylase-like protein
VHGGLARGEALALGIDSDEVLDFSVNCNPYGPCMEVVRAIRAAPLERYPCSTALLARQALAAAFELDAQQIALGNGAAELLWTLAQVLLRPKSSVMVVEPTFCEFGAAAAQRGACVHEWRAGPENDFAVDLGALGRALSEHRPAALYLCTPNTPTGVAVPANEVAALAERHGGTTLILDQSFLSLSARFADASLQMPRNVVRVRSLTKDHAIPGVRVGYVIADSTLIADIEASRPHWPTSSLAQAAAIAACRTGNFVANSRERLLADRHELEQLLRRMGLAPVPSSSGFLMVRTGAARSLQERLLRRHHILVRDCSSFGLPDYLRLAARPAAERERLAAALRQEM